MYHITFFKLLNTNHICVVHSTLHAIYGFVCSEVDRNSRGNGFLRVEFTSEAEIDTFVYFPTLDPEFPTKKSSLC